MRIATGNAKIAIQLEEHIKFFVPPGWVGPIHDFDFAPMLLPDQAGIMSTAFKEGKLNEYLEEHYKKWYVKAAIKDFFEQKG
jgi:hypothetical protein